MKFRLTLEPDGQGGYAFDDIEIDDRLIAAHASPGARRVFVVRECAAAVEAMIIKAAENGALPSTLIRKD